MRHHHQTELQHTPFHAGASDDDVFSFLDEDPQSEGLPPRTALPPWLILIVDDDPAVHEVTLITLRDSLLGDRPLQFMHAYSGREAQTLIAAQPAIDLVLLDVVMETPDAGLRLVENLHADKHRIAPRIVLRTGQPGALSDESVRARYPIDGYLQKVQQTRALLLEVMRDVLLNPTTGRVIN